jgi:putative Holliday junction resolvase
MGLDFGSKTIGVSMSDPFGWTAQGIETIRRDQEESMKSSLQRLEQIIKEYSVDTIVLGFPKNMNNTEGPRCEKTLEFKDKLEKKFGLSVILCDERLTTVSAERTLLEADMSRAKRKEVIDKMAAVYILQAYLDRKDHMKV